MLILVGPSASGKTQVAVDLIKNHNMIKFVTYTSRQKREKEVDGIDYHFLSLEEFKKRIESGFFAEYVCYNNNYYGTSFSDISSNKLVILEPNGLKTYLSMIKDKVKVVFLKCDSEVLRTRMINRGDSLESVKKRLELDKSVFNDSLENLADLVIDTTNFTAFEVSEMVYDFYKEFIVDEN